MSYKQNLKGFTIIEVVLVLAIAGLIFLMVFVALPALQSGQRDTARKQDVSSVAAAVNDFSSKNRGRLPTGTQLGTPGSGYLSSISGNITTVNIAARTGNGATTAADSTATVVTGARCPASITAGTPSVTLGQGSSRQYVVITLLEGNGGSVHCLEG